MALVTAERLHRWKCQFCGSKDKNILNVENYLEDEPFESVKVVTCSQCGLTMIFAHSALAYVKMLHNEGITRKESEDFVRNAHMKNHDDPMRNPHSEHTNDCIYSKKENCGNNSTANT